MYLVEGVLIRNHSFSYCRYKQFRFKVFRLVWWSFETDICIHLIRSVLSWLTLHNSSKLNVIFVQFVCAGGWVNNMCNVYRIPYLIVVRSTLFVSNLTFIILLFWHLLQEFFKVSVCIRYRVNSLNPFLRPFTLFNFCPNSLVSKCFRFGCLFCPLTFSTTVVRPRTLNIAFVIFAFR